MRVILSYTTGMLLLGAAGLRAQQPNQAPIPRDLVAEIVRNPPNPAVASADPEFLVGPLPQRLADRLPVPAGARVLGALVVRSDTDVYIVLDRPARTDSLEDWIRGELPRHGWRPARTLGGTPPRGGFVSPTDVVATTFCDATEQVNLRVTRGEFGSAHVRYRVSPRDYSCSAPSAVPVAISVQEHSIPQLLLPTLVHPPGVTSYGAPECNRGGNNSMNTGAVILSGQGPTDLLRYYGAQLDSAGWTPILAASSAATGAWQRRDSAGNEAVTTLTIRTLPAGNGGCRQLDLSVRAQIKR